MLDTAVDGVIGAQNRQACQPPYQLRDLGTLAYEYALAYCSVGVKVAADGGLLALGRVRSVHDKTVGIMHVTVFQVQYVLGIRPGHVLLCMQLGGQITW